MGAAETATAIVIMGPSGVGKSTTAEGLAERLDWPFAEADKFHPKANIAKMTEGVPLDDADRAPWLAAIRDWISDEAEKGVSTVLTCSALKRRYRETLREAKARVRFVALEIDPERLAERMRTRKGHFMPPSLLKSQLADLEPLAADEDGITVSVDQPPQAVIAAVVEKLGLSAR
ncbi:gluconokinase [Jiella sp. MQZ9-1]|nr:gluconokinase [Jiella flava]